METDQQTLIDDAGNDASETTEVAKTANEAETSLSPELVNPAANGLSVGGRQTVMSALEQVEVEKQLFALAQRRALALAKSDFVPAQYRIDAQDDDATVARKTGNAMIALDMAHRMRIEPLTILQNLYSVHGNPSWKAVFLIGMFNQCDRFSAIKYNTPGDIQPANDGYWCQATTTELATGEVIDGPRVDWPMVNSEGWNKRKGNKWQTMPGQMFRYRAATFLIRTTAPEIGLGLPAETE